METEFPLEIARRFGSISNITVTKSQAANAKRKGITSMNNGVLTIIPTKIQQLV